MKKFACILFLCLISMGALSCAHTQKLAAPVSLSAEAAAAAQKAAAFYYEQDYASSEKEWSAILSQFPQYDAGYINRAAVRIKLKDYESAIQDANAALKLNPLSVSAFNHRGVAYLQNGQSSRAIRDFRRAYKLDPSYAPLYYNMALAYDLVYLYDDALRYYTLAAALFKDPEIYYNRGNLYFKLSRTAQAIEDYQAAINLNGNDARFFFNIGLAYVRSKRFSEAETAFNKAIELNDKYAEAYYSRALLRYDSLENSRGAYDDIVKAHSLNPSDKAIFKFYKKLVKREGGR